MGKNSFIKLAVSNLELLQESCFGFCKKCEVTHSLSESHRSRQIALELIQNFDDFGRLDFEAAEATEGLSLDYLFGKARGQMFGVLVCEDASGAEVILKAFSCQFNRIWNVKGWVPPVLDLNTYEKIVPAADIKIKALGREIDAVESGSEEMLRLKRDRKAISQQLMAEILDLYQFHNFAGDKASIYDALCQPMGIPTGMGDCCAPKLLNFAAQKKLRPLAISEFFYGKSNKSETRQHKQFYPCCEEKCQPLLGYILCGADHE